jgi:hypothetical protein
MADQKSAFLRTPIALNDREEAAIQDRIDANAERYSAWREAGRKIDSDGDELSRQLRVNHAKGRQLALALSEAEAAGEAPDKGESTPDSAPANEQQAQALSAAAKSIYAKAKQ